MAQDGVRTRLWRAGALVTEDLGLEQVSAHLTEPDELVWIDLCQPSHERFLLLADDLGLGHLAVEDAIGAAERTKVTRGPGHLLFVTYATRLVSDHDTPIRESRLRLTKVSAFLLPQGLITVRSDDGWDIDDVVSRWDENADLLTVGPGALLHGLLDVVVDGHFDTVQGLDDSIEELEDSLFSGQASSRDAQEKSFRVRKELVELRRVVLPMREVVALVLRRREEWRSPAAPELEGWFTDLYDHVLRVTEWTESLRDMITTLFETNLSLADARLNTIMKKLTGWAAIVAVPTAITGWFGQNLPYFGFGRPFGVWLAGGSIVAASTALYVVLRRKDWI